MSEKIANATASAHQLQFNNYLVTFIQQLREVVDSPSKRTLTKYYKYYRKFVDQDKRVDFIQEFVQYISKYNKEISTSDEGLFSEEPEYYPGKPIQLLKGIDFKPIWKAESMTDKTKESIWKFLKTLYVIGTYVLKEAKRFTELLKKQQEIIYNIMQSLKLEQKIKDDAERLNEEERQKAAESGFDFSNLTELFGENNLITEMAIEIAKELNLPNEKLNDPLEAIRLLFGHDGSKLQEIIAKVGHKLHEKIQQGGISEEQLLNDAKKMNEKLVGKFKNIPGMPDIEKFSQKVAEQISKEIEDKRKNAPPGTDPNTLMPSIDELTASMNQNLSQMGLDNLEQFQKNFSEIMAEINHRETSSSNTNEQLIDAENDEAPLLLDPAMDEDLQKELDELKKNVNK